MIRLDISIILEGRISSKAPLIQVVIGPRQVGKTTAVTQALEALSGHFPSHYASADAVFRSDWSWIERQWAEAERLGPKSILVLDEVQKIENWSEVIKKLWDHSTRQRRQPRVILLGSSSLALQSGLSESLTGRFEMLRAHHWGLSESKSAFQHSLEDYLVFGGYPGADPYRAEFPRWLSYVKNSIVETVIDKDILQLRRVERPALFKQVFQLVCGYPAQEISLRKLVGQLQDPGSIETVKHYLELLEGAFLIRSLQKFSTNQIQLRSSSPKILPMCPALCTFVREEATMSADQRGRIFEMMVGMELSRLPGSLFYWRDGNDEVDFVYKQGRNVAAIEVKSGRKKSQHGITKFRQKFKNVHAVLISTENFLEFSSSPEAFLNMATSREQV